MPRGFLLPVSGLTRQNFHKLPTLPPKAPRSQALPGSAGVPARAVTNDHNPDYLPQVLTLNRRLERVYDQSHSGAGRRPVIRHARSGPACRHEDGEIEISEVGGRKVKEEASWSSTSSPGHKLDA
jgi:hypothetical protein